MSSSVRSQPHGNQPQAAAPTNVAGVSVGASAFAEWTTQQTCERQDYGDDGREPDKDHVAQFLRHRRPQTVNRCSRNEGVGAKDFDS